MNLQPSSTIVLKSDRTGALMRLAVGAVLFALVAPSALAHSTDGALGSPPGSLSDSLHGIAGRFAGPSPVFLAPTIPERSVGASDGVVAAMFDASEHASSAAFPSAALPPAAPVAAPPAAASVPDTPGVHVTYAPMPKQVYGPRNVGPGGTSDIAFVCPTPPNGLPVIPSANTDDPIVYGCPIRIHDATYTLGNAAIALNHDDHNQVAFASLHGGASTNGPHERSRAGTSVHTVFTSADHGITWLDQPPSGGQEPHSEAFGSDADIVFDSGGNTYLAYLYDIPTGPDTWDSVIGLFKGPTTESGSEISDSYNDPFYFVGRDQDNRVNRAFLSHVPTHVPLLEVEGELNETAPPANETEQGGVAGVQDYDNATDERVVMAWHEKAFDWSTSVTGLSGWIDVAWTDVGPVNDWERLNVTQLIGPCSAGSNAIPWQGDVYVACVVDKGYRDRARARVGDVDIWRVDLETGNTSIVGFSGLSGGGQPLLTAADMDGHLRVAILLQRKVYDENTGDISHLAISTGFSWAQNVFQNGARFQPSISNMGGILRNFGGGPDVKLLDADVTGFQLTGSADAALIVYKEWHGNPGPPRQPPPPEEVQQDPLRPIGDRLLDYNKFLVSFDSCNNVLAGYHVQLGSGIDAYNAQQYSVNNGTFNSVRDGLFLTQGSVGGIPEQPLVYFAIDDYGAIQYGAVQVAAVSGSCGVSPPLPPLPPAVIPQALTISSPLAGVVGAAFGVPAVAMLGYLLTVKRRAPSVVAAEDK